MTAVIATMLPPLPPKSARKPSELQRGCSAPIHFSPATCRFSDLVYLGLTSAKWCSGISLTDILTDLTGVTTQERWISWDRILECCFFPFPPRFLPFMIPVVGGSYSPSAVRAFRTSEEGGLIASRSGSMVSLKGIVEQALYTRGW